MWMSFLFENSPGPNRPGPRPMPEFLTPPNGRSGALLIVVLRPTIPTASRFATFAAWSWSRACTALPSTAARPARPVSRQDR
jgi:hypothetical protein